jgi:hypothetical protein
MHEHFCELGWRLCAALAGMVTGLLLGAMILGALIA